MSKATTIGEYLKGLEPEQRKTVQAVRKIIKLNLPNGYKEVLQYGMISYVVPLSFYPKGYLNNPNVPLPYISLAGQKKHNAIYFMGLYADSKLNSWFQKEYKASGKRLDIGKSCVRFRKLDDLPLELIGKAVGKISPKRMVEYYEGAKEKRSKKK